MARLARTTKLDADEAAVLASQARFMWESLVAPSIVHTHRSLDGRLPLLAKLVSRGSISAPVAPLIVQAQGKHLATFKKEEMMLYHPSYDEGTLPKDLRDRFTRTAKAAEKVQGQLVKLTTK